VALEVVRCAIELDRHDASRRLGVELPWNEKEEREMDAAEVIGLLGQQLTAAKCAGSAAERLVDDDEDSEWEGLPRSEVLSPVDMGEGGRSRAWSMLEAMMNDLGLNPRSMSAMASNTAQLSTARSDQDRIEDPDTDDDVVQEALEEQGRAEAAAEQDIQQMLREAPAVTLPPSGQSQTKATSRNLLTPSRAHTPHSGIQTMSSHATRATSSSPGCEAGRGEAPSAEASPNEALFLQLLEDEVSAVSGNLNHLNLLFPASPETSRATSPISSQPSP